MLNNTNNVNMIIGMVAYYPENNSTDSYRIEQYTVCVSLKDFIIHRLVVSVLLCREDETAIPVNRFASFTWDYIAIPTITLFVKKMFHLTVYT